jgi:Zn-dependent protease
VIGYTSTFRLSAAAAARPRRSASREGGKRHSTALTSLPDINLTSLLVTFFVILFSLSVHEAAHAWSASRLGDDTARRLGRVSLNPIVHIDPIGTVMLPLLAMISNAPVIGWAKPTPVNTRNLRNPRRDNILVTLAGPASNLVIAIIAAVMLRTLSTSGAGMSGLDVSRAFDILAIEALHLNVLLAVFNMLPIPPLDGGQVLLGLLPPRLAVRFSAIQSYGFLILLALLLTGMLGSILAAPYYLILSWLQ